MNWRTSVYQGFVLLGQDYFYSLSSVKRGREGVGGIAGRELSTVERAWQDHGPALCSWVRLNDHEIYHCRLCIPFLQVDREGQENPV